ncbi:DUF4115 domain-containing protein [Lentibacillus halophilus]|uniref:DUF4115 domain-containing protein n=1 Tax=Lentibacillus halophilus TaxID=295065 RepID=A0ABP3JAS9_9BACI
MEIGARLKEAREAKNLSLDKLQETTKIQKRYLEAIEQGNFDILPGNFYARAFIKEYASAVDLDGKELLEEHKEEIPQFEDENTSQYTYIQRSRKDNNPKKSQSIFSLLPTLIVVLLVIGIVAVVWIFNQDTSSGSSANPEEPNEDNAVFRNSEDGNQGDEQETNDNNDETGENSGKKPDSEQEENNDSTTNNETNNPSPELIVEETGSGASPESTLTLNHASDDVSASIEVSSDTWVAVENDRGETLYTGTISVEESPIEVDLTDTDRVQFNVGYAPTLNITIDGVPVDYPVDAQNKDHQYLWIDIVRSEEQSG